MRLLGRPGRKLSWDELRARLAAVLPAGAEVSDDPASTWVRWHEGPSVSAVQQAVGETPGWEWRAVVPDPEPSLPPVSETPTVWVRRSYSPRALMVALVRFYGSEGRYFTLDDERGRARFAALLDEDDPATCGYPIVEDIVEQCFALADPGPLPDGPVPVIDALSGRLRRLGYEKLWAEAFKRVN